MTYFRIIYGMLTRTQQQNTMNIKPPVSITNAKTMHSQLHANYITKIT